MDIGYVSQRLCSFVVYLKPHRVKGSRNTITESRNLKYQLNAQNKVEIQVVKGVEGSVETQALKEVETTVLSWKSQLKWS